MLGLNAKTFYGRAREISAASLRVPPSTLPNYRSRRNTSRHVAAERTPLRKPHNTRASSALLRRSGVAATVAGATRHRSSAGGDGCWIEEAADGGTRRQ
jgi:hypothetical protein